MTKALAATTASVPVKAWTVLLGTRLWDAGTALTTGLDGAIYIGGETSGSLNGQASLGWRNAFTAKYGVSGSNEWTRLLGVSGGEASTWAMTTGPDGSIYVAGKASGVVDFQPHRGEGDAFLTRYAPDGTKAWTRLLGSTKQDIAYGLTTGLDGSVYLSGQTSGALDGQSSAGAMDAFVAKYSVDGTKVWARQFGTSGDDTAAHMATGPDGSVYVVGGTSGALDGQPHVGSMDAFLVKFAPDGTRVWARLLGTSQDDAAVGVAIGIDGAVYISGATSGALDGQANAGGFDAFLAKYDTDGNRAWTRLFGSNHDDFVRGVTIGLDGSIFAAGEVDGSWDGHDNGGDADALLVQYTNDGTSVATWRFGTTEHDLAYDLTTGLDGSIYVSGGSKGALDGQPYVGSYDIFLTKFQVSSTVPTTPVVLPPLLGTPSADTLTPRVGSESIDGGAGLDTLVYAGTKATYQLSQSATNFVVTNPSDGDTDTLSNIERLKFSDINVALDMATTQSGGQTALLLGAVLGKASLTAKKPLVGTVLDLFDQGYTLDQLCGAVMRLPIWGALANGGQADASATEIATYLLTTAKGYAPDPATLASAVNSLANDPQGTLLWQLAESQANQIQVGLVGLMATGLEFAV